MIKKCCSVIFVVVFLMLLVSCSEVNYSYSNLKNKAHLDDFTAELKAVNVPNKDIELITSFITTYNSGDFAADNVNDKWNTAPITKSLYDYTKAINSFVSNPFSDINCMQAALIIYHSFSNIESKVIDEYQLNNTGNQNGEYDYPSIFPELSFQDSMQKTVKDFFDSSEIEFSGGNLCFVSLWGKTNDVVHNTHCGILIKKEDTFIFFEKINPMLPYQISNFNSSDILKEYLINRQVECEDSIVFIDNEPI